MKKVSILFLLISGVVAVNAQRKTDTLVKPALTAKPVINQKNIPVISAQQISPGTTGGTTTQTNATTQQKQTPPGSSAPATPVKTDADYFLAAVKATIKTGRDNKEYPSNIDIYVYPANATSVNERSFLLASYNNEIKINSTWSQYIPQRNIGLTYIPGENTLAKYRQNGLKFLLLYFANIPFDAWKIESISITLEFKDAAGNPHPTMGNKTILFTDSDLWMDGFDKKVTYYKTDSYFNPMPVKQSSYVNFRED